MIRFITLHTTNKVLKIINDCINSMVENELFYYDLIEDDEQEQIDYLMGFFPQHLCREENKNVIILCEIY